MGERGIMKTMIRILHMNNAPSSPLAATIKHCCPIKKQRSFMTSLFVSSTSFCPKAIAQSIR